MNVPISYIFLSEFDKFEGTTVKHQYPYNKDNCPLITDQLPNINLNLMPSQLQKFLNQENWTIIPIYCNNNYGVKLSLSDDDFDIKSSKTDSSSSTNRNSQFKRQSLNNSQYEPAYILTISYFKEDKSYRNGTALSLSIVTKLKFINCFKPLLTYLLHLYFIDQDFNNSISILKQLNKLPLLDLQKNFENINQFNRYFLTRIYQFENNKFDNNNKIKLTNDSNNNFKSFLLKDEAKTNQLLYGSKLSKEFLKFDEISQFYNESNNNFKINLKLSNGLPLPFTIPLNSLLTSNFFQFGYDLDNSNLLRNFLLLLNNFNLKFTSIKSNNSNNSNNHHSFNGGFSSSRTPDSIEEQSPVLPYGANDTSILLILLNCMILKKKIIVHGYDTCINDVNDVIISLLILFKNSNLTQDDNELFDDNNNNNNINLKNKNSNGNKNSSDDGYDWFKHFYPYVDLPLIDIIEELPYFIFGTSNLLFKTKKNKSGESYMWDIYLDLDSKEVHLNLDTLFTKKNGNNNGGKLNSPNFNSNGSTTGTGFMGSNFYYNRRNSSHSTYSSNSNITSTNGNNIINNGNNNNHNNSLTNSSTNAANSINDINKKFNIKNIFRKRRSISSINSNQRSHNNNSDHQTGISTDDTSSIITSNTGLGYSYDDDQDEIEYANDVTTNKTSKNILNNISTKSTNISNAASTTANNISKLERTSYTSVDSDDFDFLIDNKLLVNETRGVNKNNNIDSPSNNNNNGNNNNSDNEIETFPSFTNNSINEYHKFTTTTSKYSNHRSFAGGFNFNYQQFPVFGEMKSHINYNHLQRTFSNNTTSSSSFDIFSNSKRNSSSVTSIVNVPISRMDKILMNSIELFINENHDDYIIYITITNYLWDLKNIIFSTFNNLQTFRILKDYTNYASHKLQDLQKDAIGSTSTINNNNTNNNNNIDNDLLTDELEKFVKKEKIIQPLPLGISFEAYKNFSIGNNNSNNNSLSHSHSHHAQTHRTRSSISSNSNDLSSNTNANNNIAKRFNRSGPIVSQFSNLLGSKIMIDYYDSLLESNKFGNFGMFKEFLKENTRLNSSTMQPSVLLKLQPKNISLLGFKDFCYFLDLNYLIHCCNILAMENNGNSTIGGIKFQDDDTHQVIAFNPYDVLIKKRYIYQIFRLLNDLIEIDKNNLVAFIIYCTRFNSGVFNMAGSENSENETPGSSTTKPSSPSLDRKLTEGSNSGSGDTKYCIENISKKSGLNLTTLENIILIAMYFISEEDLDSLNNNGDLSNNGIKDSNNSNGRNSRNSYNARNSNSNNGGVNGSSSNNNNSNKFDNGSMLFEFKRFLNNFFNLQIDNNDRSYVSEWVLDNCNDFVKFGIQDFINYHY
ncbi:hypothetical protein B5S31_g5434 [[Candida] boidinii]|nr:hypothetical protein B5S31_g5434 [[Candida] boidinii]